MNIIKIIGLIPLLLICAAAVGVVAICLIARISDFMQTKKIMHGRVGEYKVRNASREPGKRGNKRGR